MLKSDLLVRYPTEDICLIKLDPLEDFASWIRGLRSKKYTAEILRDKHGFSDTNKICASSRAIAAHADCAVEFLDQAFSGPVRGSYLPIYYAMLDLAKIAVIFGGRVKELQEQRLHGAGWSGIRCASQDLLTDHITLYDRGAIALFYKTLVGNMWPKTLKKGKKGKWVNTYDRKILLRDLYPFINGVSVEYRRTYEKKERLVSVEIRAQEVEQDLWRLEVTFPGLGKDLTSSVQKREFRILSGLKLEAGKYVTPTVPATNVNEIRVKFCDRFRWFLIYLQVEHANAIGTLTPQSNSTFLLPEEIPILLAFFHLANVVRYDPERLARLFDSKACGMLEILRKHGTYDFLIAVWSFFMKSQEVVLRV